MTYTQKDLLLPLVSEAVTWELDEEQGIKFVATYDPRNSNLKPEFWKKISSRTYRRYKAEVLADENINKYFDHHRKIGFIQDHKKRRDEAELILKILKQRFLALSGSDNVDVYRLSRLGETLATWSKRAEEISLSNPVIAAIKVEVEQGGRIAAREETASIPALSQRKF